MAPLQTGIQTLDTTPLRWRTQAAMVCLGMGYVEVRPLYSELGVRRLPQGKRLKLQHTRHLK
jgi:hypothetical protein